MGISFFKTLNFSVLRDKRMNGDNEQRKHWLATEKYVQSMFHLDKWLHQHASCVITLSKGFQFFPDFFVGCLSTSFVSSCKILG